jgi:glycerophosphoryl diester phosphodiesterase
MRSSRSRAAELERLGAVPFAHRGLHGHGRVENSRAAFEAAIAAGNGIELDVQASRDGEAFVFHDYRLERLTGEKGELISHSARELREIALLGTGDPLPTLTDVLQLVRGRVPILIEVKAPDRRVGRLCSAVMRSLEGYRGPVGVMSFNPEVPHWFAVHAPRILRGLVVTEQEKRGLRGRAERRLAFWRARADFLACDIRDLPSRFAARRRRRAVPVFTWTVRSEEERARAAQHADQIIYEAAPA